MIPILFTETLRKDDNKDEVHLLFLHDKKQSVTWQWYPKKNVEEKNNCKQENKWKIG